MKVNHIRQNVFPVLAALIWGTAFVAQSVAADHVGPFTFTAARSAVAFVFLLVLSAVMRPVRRRCCVWCSAACGGGIFRRRPRPGPVPGGIWPSAVSAAAWS